MAELWGIPIVVSPLVPPNTVIIRNRACDFCGSDIWTFAAYGICDACLGRLVANARNRQGGTTAVVVDSAETWAHTDGK